MTNTVIHGIYEVPVTKELRERFEQTHQRMSVSLPAEQQFSSLEQELLMECCRVVPEKGAALEYVEAYESDLCELMDYLFNQGLSVTEIHGDIRTYSLRTRQLAMRLCLEQKQATALAEKELVA